MVGWVHTAQDAVSIVSIIYYLLSSMSYLGRVPSFSSLNRPVITSPLMLTEAIYNFHTCPPGMWRECWYQALHCSLYLYLDTHRWCPRSQARFVYKISTRDQTDQPLSVSENVMVDMLIFLFESFSGRQLVFYCGDTIRIPLLLVLE